MTPLVRTWTFALLWPLLGLLPSAAAADVPFDFNKEAVASEPRKQLEFLGYKFDEKSGRIVGPDGKVLGVQALHNGLAPYDFHKKPLLDEERTQLLLGGCRPEEDSGHVICLDAQTAVKKAMTELDLAYMRKLGGLQERHAVLERLGAMLSKEPADQPLSAETAAKAQAILKASPAAQLPASLVAALNAPGAKSGALRAQVESAYADSTRFFDGQTGVDDFFKNSRPVTPGYLQPPKSQFFDDDEKKLGLALRDSAQTYFAQSAPGRELLERFKDKDGKVQLPPFLILDLDSRYVATYNQENKTVVVGQAAVVEDIVARAPAAQQAALRAQLKDSKRFNAYLLAHPEAREAFLKQHDCDLYHELTHGWQDRRDRLFDEMGRGNTPSGMHIEYEHEAFLAELRYFHSKLVADPSSVKDNPDLNRYMSLIADFDKWRDGITQEYYQDFPRDAATLPDLQAVQAERVGIARRLMGESLFAKAKEYLKILGMDRGTEELDRVRSDSKKRMDAFQKNDYGQMQKEGTKAVAELFLLKAKQAKYPAERDGYFETAGDYARASGDADLIARVEKARKKK